MKYRIEYRDPYCNVEVCRPGTTLLGTRNKIPPAISTDQKLSLEKVYNPKRATFEKRTYARIRGLFASDFFFFYDDGRRTTDNDGR